MRELKLAGVLAEQTELKTIDDLLATLQGSSGTAARLIDIPPLELAALKRSLADLREDASDLPSPAELAALYDGLRAEAVRERRSLLEVSTGVGIAFFNSARKIGRQHVLDPYTEDLKPVRDEGFGAYAARVARPYAAAVARHFDPRRRASPSGGSTSSPGRARSCGRTSRRRFAPRRSGSSATTRAPGWARLPELEAEVCERWQLEPGPELRGGLLAHVRLVRRADGSDAVLKLAGPWDRPADEIASLRAWDGGPAPRLLEADVSAERCCSSASLPVRRRWTPPPRRRGLLDRMHVPAPAELPGAGRDRAADGSTGPSRRGAPRRSGSRGPGAAPERLQRDAAPAIGARARRLRRAEPALLRAPGASGDRPARLRGDGAYDAAYWIHANGSRVAAPASRRWPRDRLRPAAPRDWCGVVAVHG